MHLAATQLHYNEHVVSNQSPARPDLSGKEISSREPSPMGLEKLFPTPTSAPVIARLDPVLLQDSFDRRPADNMPQVPHGPDDSGILPATVLIGHTNNRLTENIRLAWTPRPPLLAPIVLPSNKLPVPTKYSVRRYDGRQIHQYFTAKPLSFNRQPAALVVIQSGRLIPMKFPPGFILLQQVLDNRCLLPVHPSSQCTQEERLYPPHLGSNSTYRGLDYNPWTAKTRRKRESSASFKPPETSDFWLGRFLVHYGVHWQAIY
jgi:hypothetical protein